jgi:hypothetical protein
MQNLPPELVEEILKKQDSIKDITRLCNSNSKNKNICENYFTHEIKSKFNSSVQIFAELIMKFNIIEIRYAGKTRFARNAGSQSDSLIIKSHKVYGNNLFMKKFKYLLSEWLKYDGNAGTPFPNRPFNEDENIDGELLDREEYEFSLKNDGENLFLQIQANNCYRLIISTPDNKLYEKIIYDYLNSKFEEGNNSFKPTNSNRGSFPPVTL